MSWIILDKNYPFSQYYDAEIMFADIIQHPERNIKISSWKQKDNDVIFDLRSPFKNSETPYKNTVRRKKKN